MNIFIHQNNETAGPFDENTLHEMLKSGQILPLTFAHLEGESSWRSISEIISLSEKTPSAAAPAPALRSPPPLAEARQPRDDSRAASGVADPPRVKARPAIEAKPPTTMKIACPKCAQHILVDESFAGMTGVCPTCGSGVPIPAFAATPPSAAEPSRTENDPVDEVPGRARSLAFRITGLQPLPGFKTTLLFADVFKNRSRPDFDAFFNCGSPSTTPDPAALGSDQPRPWFYLRMLIFGSLILFASCFAFEKFPDPKLLPALMIMGAFLVPLSCVALFFELNIPRDVSVYQVAKLIIGGAILSLPAALFLSAHTKPDFLGTMCAGVAEVIAQALIAVALLRATSQYKWILNGLLIGAAVGAGFAGIESASYILYAFFDDMTRADGKLTTFYAILADRAGFVPFCQVVRTAIVVGALWLAKGDGPFRIALFFRKPFLRIFILVIALQALWNSGMLWTSIGKFSLVRIEQGLWVISILGSCYLALLLLQEGLWQVREGVVSSNETQPETDSGDTVEK